MKYTYRCPKCLEIFDIEMSLANYMKSIENSSKVTCTNCGRKIIPTRIINNVTVIYKGDGFYSTDNERKVSNDTAD